MGKRTVARVSARPPKEPYLYFNSIYQRKEWYHLKPFGSEFRNNRGYNKPIKYTEQPTCTTYRTIKDTKYGQEEKINVVLWTIWNSDTNEQVWNGNML